MIRPVPTVVLVLALVAWTAVWTWVAVSGLADAVPWWVWPAPFAASMVPLEVAYRRARPAPARGRHRGTYSGGQR